MHINIDKKALEKDKLYGTTTVGAKGQVVIPAEARKDLNLKPGDHLLVLGKMGKVLSFMRSEDLQSIIGDIMKRIVEKDSKQEIKKHIEKVFGKTR
jgi:AbrB family looped-hinge helix DNA binding protein